MTDKEAAARLRDRLAREIAALVRDGKHVPTELLDAWAWLNGLADDPQEDRHD